ncbi:class I tRNA ligase family protein [Streptomyces chrestomyceticus]|uniref:class I tRNA ligase family protein n=1 Tax=Streptomyces chrestomyceticus TaxID=68185 RepID=UPI00067DD9FB
MTAATAPGGRGTTVLLSPPPTPNGPLHVGHLAGPYVAADVAARAARLRGERVLTVCGLDDHQNYVLARARQRGTKVREERDGHAARIRAVFDRAGVRHDVFTDPLSDVGYRTAVAGFLDELVASGTLPVREWATPVCPSCPGVPHHAYVSGDCPRCGTGSGGGTCEGCGWYTTAGNLVDARCTRCGSPLTARHTVRGPVLPLERYREGLSRVWAAADAPPGARLLLRQLFSLPELPDVPLSYPTDWGIESVTTPGHRIDVWSEMALGYLYTIGQRLAPGVAGIDGHVRAWRGVDALWAFLGRDNIFYYLVQFPALFLAFGLPPDVLGGLVVNEFYQLSGAKFSTSRGHAVWAHELLDHEEPGMLRAFLCWDRPAPYPTNFTPERYRALTASWDLAAPAAEGPEYATERDRAARALTPEHFDAAYAARCLLRPGADPQLRGALTGTAGAPVPEGARAG